MKATLITLSFIAIAVVGFVFHLSRQESIAEDSVWRQLSERLPAQELTPAELMDTRYPVTSIETVGHSDQIGHVRLANGDTWRFAFRSHHLLAGPDSFSIFSGPLGSFRVRGDYFCCEVQFPNEKLPKDSPEFLAFLRSVHSSVETSK